MEKIDNALVTPTSGKIENKFNLSKIVYIMI